MIQAPLVILRALARRILDKYLTGSFAPTFVGAQDDHFLTKSEIWRKWSVIHSLGVFLYFNLDYNVNKQ